MAITLNLPRLAWLNVYSLKFIYKVGKLLGYGRVVYMLHLKRSVISGGVGCRNV